MQSGERMSQAAVKKVRRVERTDPHRPGAIIPAHYEQRISFRLPSSAGGFPTPGWRWNCVYDKREIRMTEFGPCYSDAETGRALEMGEHIDGDDCCCTLRYLESHPDAVRFGAPGKCGVCGAGFVEGVMFVHTPTGELVFMGHDCADKYEAMYDASEAELAHDRAKAALGKAIARKKNAEKRAAFISENAGLAEAFALVENLDDDAISKSRGLALLADMSQKLTKYLSLSPKQVALALKVAGEIRNPVEKPAEPPSVPAPKTDERIEIEGLIVHTRVDGDERFSSIKMLVLVTTPEGQWKAWGTLPSSIIGKARGRRVRIRAKVRVSDKDPCFAILSRPTLISIEEPKPEDAP